MIPHPREEVRKQTEMYGLSALEAGNQTALLIAPKQEQGLWFDIS